MRPSRVPHSFPRAVATLAAAFLAFSPQAFAQDGGCLLSPAKYSDGVLKAFKAQPADLLSIHTAGGPPMTLHVSRLAGSDLATVPLLIGLAREAQIAQIVAIGMGLARAFITCEISQIHHAQYISDQVAQSNIPALIAAFASGKSTFEVRQMTAGAAQADTAAPIGNLRQGGGGGAFEGAQSRTGSDRAPSRSDAPVSTLQFGGAGVSRTVGESVSPTR